MDPVYPNEGDICNHCDHEFSKGERAWEYSSEIYCEECKQEYDDEVYGDRYGL